MENFKDYPDRIAETFNDKTILVTGATGFVGKVFVEKLLRSCSNVKKIYLFVRTKKNKSPNGRIAEIFKGPLFDLLKKERGEDILKKVETISADLQSPDLSLSAKDRMQVVDEVEMIYHCAATVRFDEKLKEAVFMNVRGTKLMLELAKECKKLTIFAHLSTAYCHLKEKVLYEKVYSPPADPHKIIQICELLEEELLDMVTNKILGDIPNTYVFTKALGESLVSDEMDSLPVIILRPSIIIPIWKEPLVGWTDNMNGPVGLLIGAGKGVIRTMYCRSDIYADYVPVDILANCMITTTFFYFQTKKNIYNLTSSAEYKKTFKEIIDMGRDIVTKKIPFNWIVWYPGGSMKRFRFLHNIDFFFFQLIPAIIVDAVLIMIGQKPILMKIQKRIRKGYEVFEYFANNQWEFNNDEFMALRKKLNPTEKAMYKSDFDGMNYYEYFVKCIYGGRRYILKETDDTIPLARRHTKVMWFVDKICKIGLLSGLMFLLYKWIFLVK